MRKEDGFARFTRVRALLGARAMKEEPMQGRRKSSTSPLLMLRAISRHKLRRAGRRSAKHVPLAIRIF